MSQAELPVLRVAYMPLIECAPLVAASRLGLDQEYGLQLQLHRQAHVFDFDPFDFNSKTEADRVEHNLHRSGDFLAIGQHLVKGGGLITKQQSQSSSCKRLPTS